MQFRLEFLAVDYAIDRRMADKRAFDPPLTKPAWLKRKQAQHTVSQFAKFANPPAPPRPHLWRSEVHDAGPCLPT